MSSPDLRTALDTATDGVTSYLRDRLAAGALAQGFFEEAVENVAANLEAWLLSDDIARLSPNLHRGVVDAIEAERWEELTNAYVRQAKFGTGGIRALMAFRKEDIEAMAAEGLDAPILKGPNTLNNVVVAQCAWGVARYFADHHEGEGHPWAVVGFDSRIRGQDFAEWVAAIFLSEGLGVYLFDEAVPYPEVTFAIPTVGADVGVFISASHNDYRYNGFKLSGPNGSQVSPTKRDAILNDYIRKADLSRIHPVDLTSLSDEEAERLVFLGSGEAQPGRDYYGRESSIRDMHSRHAAQVKKFLVEDDIRGKARDLRVAYSAFNGAGRRLVPRLLNELGFEQVYRIKALDELNGFFPAFKSDPGEEQQPDPGDPRAAAIALRELKKEVDDPAHDDAVAWSDSDLLLGTDPDADRSGVIAKPGPDLAPVIEERLDELSRNRYSAEHVLIPADDVWTLLLWYRATRGALPSLDASFIALSHTTCDAIVRLAQSHGIGVLKTWVGFGWLAAGVAEVWKRGSLPAIAEGREEGKGRDDGCHPIFYDTTALGTERSYNAAALEQSNGFSILGGPPADFPEPDRSMGVEGHVRDKDGTFASILAAELAAEAKARGTDLLELLAEEIFLNPEVGIFANYYEPDPIDGEYPGLEGDSKKRSILEKTLEMAERAPGGEVSLAGHTVSDAWIYRTGKYDEVNWKGFPDEGIRFYFGNEYDYLTVRPSGTSNALRFHVQLRWNGDEPTDAVDAWRKRLELEIRAKKIVDELRERVGAPRLAGSEL